MISRTPIGLLSATLALAATSPLHAVPTAPADTATVSTATYHVERHGSQVTVKDADGKLLATFSAATPTIRGLYLWGAAGPAANTPRSLSLTLRDQNGGRLWSTPVPVVYPQTVSVNYNSTAGGALLMINTTQNDAPDPDYPPASGLSFTLGADGRPIDFSDTSHRYTYVYEPHGFSIVDQCGKVVEHVDIDTKKFEITGPAGYNLHLNQDGTGTMQINKMSIAIDKVTKDGMIYQSFPWNGHKVFIGMGCNWNVTSDGDLTVNAPAPDKKAARK